MYGQIHADFLRLLWVLADKQMRSYYESMGKEDKIGNEAFRWVRAKVFNYNKTSVGRAIAFGCATRCHLSVHMRRNSYASKSVWMVVQKCTHSLDEVKH